MAGYIGSKASVTQVDGYTKSEADARYVEGDDTLYVDQTNNRVGIKTSSPASELDVVGAIRLTNMANSANYGTISDGGGLVINSQNNNPMYFYTGSSEKARLTSSGNLLVGKTAEDNSTVGARLQPDGVGSFCADGSRSLIASRNSSDGDIQLFLKNNTTVGGIGVDTGDLTIYSTTASHVGVKFGNTRLHPTNNSGANADGTVDLGYTNTRWDTVYATTGTINTSDAAEKQQIASLTDAEITAAKAISKLFKTYKWNSAVEIKGDAARTHTGVIAQDVEQAMTDAGLNAGDYAFFISTTWWETSTEVAAVEADEENGIEAQAAYTRTDTYDTADEAPEGATERNRKGIRYPELLSFIGAATEQRLTSIEDRLDALEAG